jgi:hypothetical protein
MRELIWNLFKETGDIKYYLLLKNINKRSDEDEDRGSRRNSN